MDSAQISAEFLLFLSLAFLVALAFQFVSLEQLTDFRIAKENEAAKDIALKLQRELLLASTVEDGYVRFFELPNELENGDDYFLTIQNSSIIVQSKNSFYIMSIPNVVGNASKSDNKINKTGGVIYIN